MSAQFEQRYTVFGVNGKNTGSTLLATTENGVESFHPVWLTFVLLAASAITTPCTVSVGANGGSFNNIMAAAVLTGLVAVNTLIARLADANSVIIPANTGISLNVTIGAIATTMTFKASIMGYYE